MPICRPFLFFLGLLISILPCRVLAAQTPTKAELSSRGKAASALLEIRPGNAYASCFCVHDSGLFITAESAIRDRADSDAVTLILNAGSKEQRSLKAGIVRIDKDRNLALLRGDGLRQVPTLPLGSD